MVFIGQNIKTELCKQPLHMKIIFEKEIPPFLFYTLNLIFLSSISTCFYGITAPEGIEPSSVGSKPTVSTSPPRGYVGALSTIFM